MCSDRWCAVINATLAFTVFMGSIICIGPANSQDGPKIEIVPNVNHSQAVSTVAVNTRSIGSRERGSTVAIGPSPYHGRKPRRHSMARLLVTGGAGYVGSHALRALVTCRE